MKGYRILLGLQVIEFAEVRKQFFVARVRGHRATKARPPIAHCLVQLGSRASSRGFRQSPILALLHTRRWLHNLPAQSLAPKELKFRFKKITHLTLERCPVPSLLPSFVMAEILGIPYLHVAIAATIPAILYFYGVGCGIYFSARKYGLGKVPKELMPKAREVFEWRQMVNLLIPIAVMVYLLALLLPPQMAAGAALIAIMIVYLLLGGSLSRRELWGRVRGIGAGYFEGATGGLAMLMVLGSCVQMSVSLVSLTGLAVNMSEVIMELASVHLLVALTAAMGVTMVLGMGMPTTAAYIIAAVVLGPSLIGLGVPGLALIFLSSFTPYWET